MERSIVCSNRHLKLLSKLWTFDNFLSNQPLLWTHLIRSSPGLGWVILTEMFSAWHQPRSLQHESSIKAQSLKRALHVHMYDVQVHQNNWHQNQRTKFDYFTVRRCYQKYCLLVLDLCFLTNETDAISAKQATRSDTNMSCHEKGDCVYIGNMFQSCGLN